MNHAKALVICYVTVRSSTAFVAVLLYLATSVSAQPLVWEWPRLQGAPPAKDDASFVQVAAGWYHSVGLRSDGTVIAWGGNVNGATAVPASLAGVIQVATGDGHGIALRTNGRVVTWGETAHGLSVVPERLTDVVQVAAGSGHVVALRSNGTLVAWGLNSQGQTSIPPVPSDIVQVEAGGQYTMALRSDGTIAAWGSLKVPDGLSGVVHIAAGYSHAIALRSDGTTVGWGSNTFGELNVPAGLEDVVQVVGGWGYTAALQADGTVVAWGRNDAGQTDVPAWLSGVRKLAAGATHLVALRNDGTVVTWGNDDHDQARVLDLEDVTQVIPGNGYTLALRSNGTVLAWGGTSAARNVPPGLTRVVELAAGDHHALALRSDGTVVAWGADYYGLTYVPEGLTDVVSVAAGDRNAFAIRRDGTVVAWGDNSSGQTKVPAWLDNVVQISAALHHTLALRSDGTVVAWGNYGSSEVTVPAGLRDVVQVAAGRYHSAALRSDGTVVVWGGYDSSQAEVPPGLDDVIQVVAGELHVSALRSDGTVVTWGGTSMGQIGVPDGLRDVARISASRSHTVALRRAAGMPSPVLLVEAYPQAEKVYPGEEALFTVSFRDGDRLPVRPSRLSVRVSQGEEVVHHSVMESPNGEAYSYRVPDTAVRGETFTFRFGADSGSHSYIVSKTVSLTVGNTPPSFASEPARVATAFQPFVHEVVTRDHDGDVLSLHAALRPAWLTFVDNGDGTGILSGTPTNADAGANPITLTVSDGEVTVGRSLAVAVEYVNLSPAIESVPPKDADTFEDYVYDVRASDPDGDVLMLSALRLPRWLSFVDNGDGTGRLSGTPGAGDEGEVEVALKASDGELEATQAFTIAVTYVHPPPTAAAITAPTEEHMLSLLPGRSAIRISWSASQDAAGGTVTYRWMASLDEAFAEPLLSAETTSTSHELNAAALDEALAASNVGPGNAVIIYQRVVASVFRPDRPQATTGPTSTLRVSRALAAGTENGGLLTELAVRGAYPNPVSDPFMRIAFDLPSSATVTVEVYDGLGRAVVRVEGGVLAPGAGHEVTVPVGELPAGTFSYRLHASYEDGRAQVASGRVRVVR